MSDKPKDWDEYCKCNKRVSGAHMIGCSYDHCPNGKWFHYSCLDITEEDVATGDWFCTAQCRVDAGNKSGQSQSRYAVISFTVDETSQRAPTMKIKKVNVPKIDVDHKVEYSKSVLWNGLNNAARKDALKENDGDRIIRHWRFDLPRFHNNHHTKYVTHAASLMIAMNGGAPLKFSIN